MFGIILQLKYKQYNIKSNNNNLFRYNKQYLTLINLKCLKQMNKYQLEDLKNIFRFNKFKLNSKYNKFHKYNSNKTNSKSNSQKQK